MRTAISHLPSDPANAPIFLLAAGSSESTTTACRPVIFLSSAA
jgi:hypothetical protein